LRRRLTCIQLILHGKPFYGTAETSLDIKEYEEIQRPVVNPILPKMGINRSTSRSVVFGTSKYGGLGLDHLAVVQGFGQLQYLIGGMWTQDTTGDLYQMLLEYAQLEYGIATPILEANFARYEHAILTKKWITECWRYLSLCKSSVTISGLWSPTKGRLRDAVLMDKFTMQGLSDKKNPDVNRCHIYLRAFYISDIMDLAVKYIEAWAKQGKRQASGSGWSNKDHQPPHGKIGNSYAKASHQQMGIYFNICDHGETSKIRTKTQNGIWTPVQRSYTDTMKAYGQNIGPSTTATSGSNQQE
jgi:hypothetical protein